MDSQLERAFKAKMETFSEGLSADPGGAAVLAERDRHKVFRFLLDSVCQAQTSEAGRLGTQYLLGLPRAWTVERLREVVDRKEFVLDDFAFRRLVDLCAEFERLSTPQVPRLLSELLDTGAASEDQDVREDVEAFRASRRRSPPPFRLATRHDSNRFLRIRFDGQLPPEREIRP